MNIKLTRGLIANTAIQCIDPRSGNIGDWIFLGDNHRDPSSAISPVFSEYMELFNWCKDNNWKNIGYSYVYEPNPKPFSVPGLSGVIYERVDTI